ncbi:hypothetical protein D3C81_1590230 [compost metagenome]
MAAPELSKNSAVSSVASFWNTGARLAASVPHTRAMNTTNGTPEELAGEGSATAPAYSCFHRSFQLLGGCLISRVL